MSYMEWRFKKFMDKVFEIPSVPTSSDIIDVLDYLHNNGLDYTDENIERAVREVGCRKVTYIPLLNDYVDRGICMCRYRRYIDVCEQVRLNDYMNAMLLNVFLQQDGVNTKDEWFGDIPLDIEMQYKGEIVDTLCSLSELYTDQNWSIPTSYL